MMRSNALSFLSMSEDQKPTQEELDDAADDLKWMFPHDGYDYWQHVREIGGGTFLELVCLYLSYTLFHISFT